MRVSTFNDRNARSGIALILVMVTIVFLGILAGGFAYSMKVETTLARYGNLETDMEWMGKSGIELAKYVLSQQMMLTPQFDCLQQKWAGGPGNSNEILSAITMEKVPLGMGTITVKIIDCERRQNINIAQPDMLQRGLSLLNVQGADASAIMDSIQDWIDPDDHPRMSGAESDYYQTLNPAYFAKNGPLDDISELLMVRGITPEIYWGSVGPNPDRSGVQTNQPAMVKPSQLATYNGGMVDLFSAVSGPQINLNTAPIGVLQLLPGVDENVAGSIIRLRSGPDGMDGTEDDTPFHNAGELINVPGMNPGLVQQITRYCGVRSLTFEVQVDVQINQYTRHYVGLVRRNNPRDLPLLFLYSR